MRIDLYKSGNLTGFSQSILIIIGAFFSFSPAWMGGMPRWLVQATALVGILFVFVGGFSARAQLSGLRVFGKPDWKRAKETYSESDKINK
jgi:membrane-bound acyltransferase YfiQ involved in biofilm formation